MRCPIDDAPLREVTRQSVKIDLCPECRGVWLDRGELDHLLDASADVDDRDVRGVRGESRAPESRPAPRYDVDRSRDSRARHDDDDDDHDDDRRRGNSSTGNPPAKKRKSWLSDIFEMGE